MRTIQAKFLDGLRLHEFFLCDVPRVVRDVWQPALQNIDPKEMEAYRREFDKKGWFSWDRFRLMRKELSVGHGSGPKRMGVSLKMPDAAMFFMLANNQNRTQAVKEVEALLCRLNDHWMSTVKGFLAEARNAIEGNIRYFKLECRRSLISAEKGNWILDPYFSELPNAQRSKVAHNGWVMGHNCMEDFGYVGWHYLRRTINIWGDCIKLRYGSCPADSPYLW
jgi:glycogen debranching enzyme